ncbi:sugar phosphate isomerase/epimerase [Candidatus Sumerlaeota bacterium]|nr:sugar phosphate isomerase/epimerase [Candidatus Sumerlaeota bacterium]
MRENDSHGLSRRSFLTGVSSAALGAAAVGMSNSSSGASQSEKPARQPKDKIRLGSVAWNFGRIGDDPPWTASIDAIGELGFDGIELIVAKPNQLDATISEPTLSEILRRLERHKLKVSQFVLYQTVTADLGSPDREKQKRALALFEKGCRVAVKLGAPIINMVAPWPTSFQKEGQGYLPRYYSTGTTMPSPKFSFTVPRNFDWPKAWSDFVAVMKETTAIAKNAGLLFALENHTHTFVPGPDAFLRLWDEVHDPALGFSLDIGWVALQREYPVVAVYKTRGHLMNLHIRDLDGFAYRFVAPGSGCMDYEGLIVALRAIGFSGFITFEQDGVPDMKHAMRRGMEIFQFGDSHQNSQRKEEIR